MAGADPLLALTPCADLVAGAAPRLAPTHASHGYMTGADSWLALVHCADLMADAWRRLDSWRRVLVHDWRGSMAGAGGSAAPRGGSSEPPRGSAEPPAEPPKKVGGAARGVDEVGGCKGADPQMCPSPGPDAGGSGGAAGGDAGGACGGGREGDRDGEGSAGTMRKGPPVGDTLRTPAPLPANPTHTHTHWNYSGQGLGSRTPESGYGWGLNSQCNRGVVLPRSNNSSVATPSPPPYRFPARPGDQKPVPARGHNQTFCDTQCRRHR